MGVRFSRRHLRVVAAHGSRAAVSSSAARNGTVYSLDAKSGCIHWTFTAMSGVRTALSFGARGDAGFASTSGTPARTSTRSTPRPDASSGRAGWTITSTRASPDRRRCIGDRLYVPVSSMEETRASQQGYGGAARSAAALNALDVRTVCHRLANVHGARGPGRREECRRLVALWGPSGVGIWSAPTIDARRGLVYAGTGNTYSAPAQADRRRHRRVSAWRAARSNGSSSLTAGDVFGCRAGSANCGEKAGPDFDLGTPPMLVTVVGASTSSSPRKKSGNAFAIDPDKEGALLWQYHAG